MTLAAPIPTRPVAGAPAAGPAAPLAVEDAEARLYDAEVNLHHARQSGIDSWISAAYDHLHLALLAHAAACGLPASAA
jgi:hypothetical protein